MNPTDSRVTLPCHVSSLESAGAQDVVAAQKADLVAIILCRFCMLRNSGQLEYIEINATTSAPPSNPVLSNHSFR